MNAHLGRTAPLRRAAGALLAALALAACGDGGAGGDGARTADLVLRNGRLVTLDDARPEASALAVVGDRIVAVGSDEEIESYVGPATTVVDLGGRLAIPGFIESHGHFMGLGRSKMILDLTTARTWDDIVAMVGEAARAARPGEWIVGRGWHQAKWEQPPQPSVEGNPVHAALSAVSPENPVYLTHASGHASFANATAMELAGIGPATANPPGGEIIHDATGQPTGLLRETAQRMVAGAMAEAQARRSPEVIDAERREMVRLAGAEALARGVTSFHDAGTGFETIDLYRTLADEGALPIRLYAMIGAGNDELAEKLPRYRLDGYGNGFLTVRSIKRSIDGALGSHGAWLLEPYTDLPRSSGLNLIPIEDLRRTAELAAEHGFQLNTHAIGDRGNREVLDVYQSIFEANGGSTDLRWRIEHAQHLDPADIPRFSQLGVIASMQGVHATSDGPWVPEKLGDARAEAGAYVWRKLIDSGAVVTNGTDVPVEAIDPIASYYASVSRRLNDGSVFYGEQRMTREEALRSYTINSAFAAFEEELKGSLSPGKLADITVLSQDILTIPEEEIPSTRVVYTILGGRVRFQDEGAARDPGR